jgi:hypothetical protein
MATQFHWDEKKMIEALEFYLNEKVLKEPIKLEQVKVTYFTTGVPTFILTEKYDGTGE